MTRDFDPGAAASFDGIYGLPHSVDEARVVVVPVPWDATTSYRPGTSLGPAAVFEASKQVDLFDLETGRPYEAGIAMLPISDEVVGWNDEARRLAQPIIDVGGEIPDDDPAMRADLATVNALGADVNAWVRARTSEILAAGKTAVVLGGDHSSPFGAFQAYAQMHPGLGILHFDAHFDLRDAYEGFEWSHASIMNNALRRIPAIARIVHVGIRDFSEAEHETSRASSGRSVAYFESDMRTRAFDGEAFRAIAEEIVEHLPPKVFVSFDVDGLDPALCPGTGTPVPGGLSFREATAVIGACVKSGRTIVGCDLNEVAPRDGDGEWNANVGARLLYKLIGFMLMSQRAR